jgi:cation diffusion facilitator family transporter
VLAALAANAGIFVTKLVVAVISSNAALLAEAFHSAADTGNQALLLLGLRRSERPPDEEHPFGHGQERFFWTLIVAICLFTIGGTLSVVEGIARLVHGEKPGSVVLVLVVLALAALFEGGSLRVSWKQFGKARGEEPLWRALRESKDPEVLSVLAEDSAALVGIALAATGTILSAVTGSGAWDAAASVAIGLLLGVVAVLLARETMALLIGETAGGETRQAILDACEGAPHVDEVLEVLTMHTAPHEILVTADVRFDDDLSTDEVEQAIDRLEERIRRAAPEARRIYVEPEERGPAPASSAAQGA